MKFERDQMFRPRQANTLSGQIHFLGAFDQLFPSRLFDEHEIDWSVALMWRLELRERGNSVEKTIPKFAQEIEPLRARLLWNQKVKIDRIPNVSEKNDRICANKEARQASLRGSPKNFCNLFFQLLFLFKIDKTAATTSSALTAFMQRKSIGHSRRKQGLHST